MGNACGISDDQDYSESDRPSTMRQRQQIYQGKGRKQSKIIEKEFQDFEEYKSITHKLIKI